MIHGVDVKQLTTHADERGFFREILRSDDPFYTGFGQTSMTMTYPGVIKAFHYHELQDDIWYVAKGMAQCVFYDMRPDSPTHKETQVIVAGDNNQVLIKIPIGVAHGYRVLGPEPVTLFYHTTKPYNAAQPDEKRIPWDDPSIGFDWTTKNR